MASRLDQPQGRGAFFRNLGNLMAGFLAEQVSETVTDIGPKLLRPPGALEEFDFLIACTRCDRCRLACPQDAILKAPPSAGLAMGTPYIDPRAMPCFLCTELPCISACPDQALQWPNPIPIQDAPPLEGPKAVRMGSAKIRPSLCLTHATEDRAALACHTCLDRCPYPEQAIRMEAVEGDPIPHPILNTEYCTGCGLCVFACPTLEPAIIVVPRG